MSDQPSELAGASRRMLGYWLVLAAAASWATGGLLARWIFVGSTLEVDAMELAAARGLVAAVLMLGWMLVARREALRVPRGDLLFLVLFGIIGQAFLHWAYYEAIAWAGVATAILLEYLALVLVLLVSTVFLGERMTAVLPVAVVLAVSGCALVVGLIGGGADGLSVPVEGIAWGLAAAVAYAAYMLMGRRAAGRIEPSTLLTWGLAVAAVFWLIVVGPGRLLEILSDGGQFAAVIYVAVISTIIPFGFFLTALRHIDATRAGVTATVEPVLAGALAWLVLDEALDVWQLVGALLVLAAIILVQLPARRLVRLPPSN